MNVKIEKTETGAHLLSVDDNRVIFEIAADPVNAWTACVMKMIEIGAKRYYPSPSCVSVVLTGEDWMEDAGLVPGEAHTQEEAMALATEAGYSVIKDDEGGNTALVEDENGDCCWVVTVKP